MFLLWLQFYVNYYGGLNRDGVWFNYNKVIGYCEINVYDYVNFGVDNNVGNND